MRIAKAVSATVVGLSVLALAASALRSDRVPVSENATAQPDTGDRDRGDCPGPYFEHIVPGRKGPELSRQTKLGGVISEVPEFHDCQRFVNSGGEYDALFAV